ncbi:Rpn family recombination-promoting nuclease/putative transposase [Fibrobacter sp.]|uniref:Rpn family recombination-promoting nuclease/putative transposase n=1 Tax=Fibrobacter sp. TaxID=35828 RepID=UPI00388CF2CA
MTRKYKSVEELTIRDNFMFVKVFSDEEIAKPFLKALLKIDIEKITIVGEAHLQTDPSKKYIRFDVMAKEEGAEGVGRVFDLEMQMVDRGELPKRARYYQGICDTETLACSHKYKELKEQYIIFLCPEDVFGRERPIYEFENREKNDHSLTLGDLTYKIFCNFSKYDAVTDESVRDYLKYFATDEATSEATQKIQNQVDFYHKDPKTRSDYVTFKDMLEDERDEGRAEGRAEGAKAKAREMAKVMLAEGLSIDMVAKCSGLSEDEIKAL